MNMNSSKLDIKGKLIDLLKDSKLDKGDKTSEVSHTSYGKPWGKYYVSDDKTNEFISLYTIALRNGTLMHFIERPKLIAPLCIDIDFKFESIYQQRNYTTIHIKSLIKRVNDRIMKYINVTEDELISYVFEKHHPTHNVKHNQYKDGFHIIYPFIAMNKDMRYFIIDTTRQDIVTHKDFSEIPFCNDINDVFNASVMKYGWAMYGSIKDKGQLYSLTSIYNHNVKEHSVEKLNKIINSSQTPAVLSVRKFSEKDEHPLLDSTKGADFIQQMKTVLEKYEGTAIKKIRKKNIKLIDDDDINDNDMNNTHVINENSTIDPFINLNMLKWIDAKHNIPNLSTIFNGKNILIFNLKVTGFNNDEEICATCNHSFYKDHDKFKDMKILQVEWKYIENWNKLFDKGGEKIYYVKLKDILESNNQNTHKQINKYANEKGKLLKNIINKYGFGYAIENTDYIITYGANCDVHILLHELSQLKYERKKNKILKLLDDNKTLNISMCKKYMYVGLCKLEKFYKHNYGILLENVPDQKTCINILLDILNKIIGDQIINKINKQSHNINIIKYDKYGEDYKIEKNNVNEFYGFGIKIDKVINANIMKYVKSIFYGYMQHFKKNNMQFRNIYSSIVINKRLYLYGSFVSNELITTELINNYCAHMNIKFEALNICHKSLLEWEKNLSIGLCDNTRIKNTNPKNLSNINKELPVNHGAKWTDENIDELVKLTKTNEIEFIIDSLGRTKGSIISQIRRAMNYKYLNKTDIKSNKILEIINKYEQAHAMNPV